METEFARRTQLRRIKKDRKDVRQPQMHWGFVYLQWNWLRGLQIRWTWIMPLCQAQRSHQLAQQKGVKTKEFHQQRRRNIKWVRLSPVADQAQWEVLLRQPRGQVPPDHQQIVQREGVQVPEGKGGRGVLEQDQTVGKFRQRQPLRLPPRPLQKHLQKFLEGHLGPQEKYLRGLHRRKGAREQKRADRDRLGRPETRTTSCHISTNKL